MKYILISLITVLSSCQWVLTHPEVDEEVFHVCEDIAVDMYEYETGHLSPTPPVGPTQTN